MNEYEFYCKYCGDFNTRDVYREQEGEHETKCDNCQSLHRIRYKVICEADIFYSKKNEDYFKEEWVDE